MNARTDNFYADWRAQHLRNWLLHEGAEPPPEKLLQLVWFHQRLQRDRLVTHDGRPVGVLHPGFWNREAGPDFRGAMIRLGHETPRTGDIEVDLHSSGWRSHKHAGNPNFQKVLLHVVWATETPTDLPTLPLRGCLDAPVDDLMLWLGGEESAGFPPALTGQCAAPLRSLAPDKLEALLRQAALVRLHSKAAWLSARARQAGWEQALWEGLFRALGYKQNVWPMQLLGELRPLRLQAIYCRFGKDMLSGTASSIMVEGHISSTGRDVAGGRVGDRHEGVRRATLLPNPKKWTDQER